MVYPEFENLKESYERMQSVCDSILREKEKYFTKTQPNAVRYDRVGVAGGVHSNGFDEYLDECKEHKIDERLNEAISILQARAELMRLKELDLRASKDINDIVYVMKFLDNAKPSTIAMALSYSESQIYRIIEKIQKRRK